MPTSLTRSKLQLTLLSELQNCALAVAAVRRSSTNVRHESSWCLCPTKVIRKLLLLKSIALCLHQDTRRLGGLQFTGQEKVVANFGFCFLGGGFDDLRFLQQQHRQSQQLWLTADDPETLQAHVARRVKHPSPHDSLQLQRGENRIQEALDGRACLHGADCWSAVSWLGRRGVLQVLGAQQTVWSDAIAAVVKLCDESKTVIRRSWASSR